MRILFVCLGNICRSPTAEAILRHQLVAAGLESQVEVDSAGTGDWHLGKSPDARAIQAGAARGYDLGSLTARQVTSADFYHFDLVLAMDKDNLAYLHQLQPVDAPAKLDLLLERYELQPAEVPDPYYGGEQGFQQVLDLLEQACAELVKEIRSGP